MNPALARRADTDTGAAWVVPGNGSVCLVINMDAVPTGGTDLSKVTDSCITDDLGTAGKLVMSTTFWVHYAVFIASSGRSVKEALADHRTRRLATPSPLERGTIASGRA
jgi:hypothetical protein